MKHYVSLFLSGILAGVFIAIGGSLNLQLSSMGYPVIGGFAFSVGLMAVCLLGASLFTGKVGYAFENKPSYVLDLVVMMVGNLIGALAIGYLAGTIFKTWNVPLESKFIYGENSTFWNSFLRAIGAGALVYLAVECFKRVPSIPGKLLMVLLSIGAMVLLGFNHSIANAFYFGYCQITVYGFDALNATLSVLVALLGNAIGSLLLYFLQYGVARFAKKKDEPTVNP